jgi:hypothetical protein
MQSPYRQSRQAKGDPLPQILNADLYLSAHDREFLFQYPDINSPKKAEHGIGLRPEAHEHFLSHSLNLMTQM